MDYLHALILNICFSYALQKIVVRSKLITAYCHADLYLVCTTINFSECISAHFSPAALLRLLLSSHSYPPSLLRQLFSARSSPPTLLRPLFSASSSPLTRLLPFFSALSSPPALHSSLQFAALQVSQIKLLCFTYVPP